MWLRFNYNLRYFVSSLLSVNINSRLLFYSVANLKTNVIMSLECRDCSEDFFILMAFSLTEHVVATNQIQRVTNLHRLMLGPSLYEKRSCLQD